MSQEIPHAWRRYVARYLTEFVGTFALVFTIETSVATAGNYAPFAIGICLMVMIWMGGHVSGAHYNPAVTLGIVLRGKLNIVAACIYWLVQLLGGVIGAAMGAALTGKTVPINPSNEATHGQALMAELICTFFLVSVVLHTATTKSQEGNGFFGAAIGMTVLFSAYSCGPISGGAFNPAVGFGLTCVHGGWDHVYLYFIGPLFGGALASLLFWVACPDEFPRPTESNSMKALPIV